MTRIELLTHIMSLLAGIVEGNLDDTVTEDDLARAEQRLTRIAAVLRAPEEVSK